jgi:transcriptional regulator with GAF, ATPase, and Fis domain
VSLREELLRRFQALLEEARQLDDPAVLAAMRQLLETADAVDDDDEAAESWHGLIGRAPAIVALRPQLEKFAQVASPVLIRGESGTGKDLVARILHDLGPRAGKAMVSENCAAIPETLLESVLFGHVRGAFTGAVRDHGGHFVAADGGTLFLDEIGDMSLGMQAKMLRVLQDGEVRPVGGEKVRKVDVRVIAATHRDLEAMVRARQFREDLFYRLNVLQVHLPPLRERGDDIELLARHFLAQTAKRAGRELRLTDAVGGLLRAYAWPGNIRQLQNEMQRIAALADGPAVEPGDLSPEIRGAGR